MFLFVLFALRGILQPEVSQEPNCAHGKKKTTHSDSLCYIDKSHAGMETDVENGFLKPTAKRTESQMSDIKNMQTVTIQL